MSTVPALTTREDRRRARQRHTRRSIAIATVSTVVVIGGLATYVLTSPGWPVQQVMKGAPAPAVAATQPRPIKGETMSVRGRVLAPDGRPAAGANVFTVVNLPRPLTMSVETSRMLGPARAPRADSASICRASWSITSAWPTWLPVCREPPPAGMERSTIRGRPRSGSSRKRRSGSSFSTWKGGRRAGPGSAQPRWMTSSWPRPPTARCQAGWDSSSPTTGGN